MTTPYARTEQARITVRQLPADRRKHVRVPASAAPLWVDLGAERLEVVDWSPGGLRVAAAAPAPDATLQVAVGDGAGPFAVRARTVWAAGGEVGLAFTSLPEAARARLTEHAAPWTGAGDTPPAASTVAPPVDAVAPPRVLPPPVAAPPRRWRPPLRAILYLVLGVLLTAWLGSALYRRVWRIEVDAASLVAATARVASPADGVVRELLVADGDTVREGQEAFRVEAAGVDAQVERAALEMEAARAEVARLEAERVAAAERLGIEGRVARARARAERRQVALLAQRVGWAGEHVTRVEALGAAAGVSAFDLDEVRGRRAELAGQLEAARARLAAEQTRVDAVRRGYAFDGERVAAALPEADAALAAARTTFALAERRLASERTRAEALRSARVPFAGRVSAVLQTAGAAVRQGTVVVVVERDEDRQVEAWVTRQEAGYVRLGSAARVYVPGVGRTYDAVVRSIGAESAASEAAMAVGGTPRLRVVLDLAGYAGEPDSRAAAMAELRKSDSVGLPAVVSLPRSWR